MAALLRLNIRYVCGKVVITLPADHRLPEYQQAFHDYDRFLPHLARHIPAGKTVVDVGANCGDTLAAMYSANGSLRFICIEADDHFFRYLEANVARITAVDSRVAIRVIKSFVGLNVASADLAGSGGTKHAVPAANGPLRSAPLDALLADEDLANIRLLKLDVDGYDYDVLDSATHVLSQSRALLYFECHLRHESQTRAFQSTIGSLLAIGYRDWSVFDNYGQFILRTGDVQVLMQLIEYLARQIQPRSARTIYYFDLLAVNAQDSALVTQILASY